MSKKIKVDTLVICFSTSGWDAEIWTNKQHLMSRLSAKSNYHVLYVDQGLSATRLKNIFKDFTQNDFPGITLKRSGNLHTISPYFLPLIKGGYFKRKAWIILGYYLRRIISKFNYKKLIVWVYQPQAWYLLKEDILPGDFYIYDCVDDFKSQPGYKERKKRREELIETETRLCEYVDLVTTTSPALKNEKKMINSNTVLVHNVGDFNHFNRVASQALQKVQEDRAVVFYSGVVDDYKIDLVFLDRVSSKFNDYIFKFAGPVRVKKEHALIRKIMDRENVYFLGTIPYDELPSVMSGADVLLMPYLLNDHTRYVFPLKLFEYMATGIPILARNLPSYKCFHSLLLTYSTPDEAFQKLQDFQNDDLGPKRIEAAREHTWEQRLETILKLIDFPEFRSSEKNLEV